MECTNGGFDLAPGPETDTCARKTLNVSYRSYLHVYSWELWPPIAKVQRCHGAQDLAAEPNAKAHGSVCQLGSQGS